MRPLTSLERDSVVHQVALAIAWDGLEVYRRDNALRTAKAVVAEMERGAIHGATTKRALEALCAKEAVLG